MRNRHYFYLLVVIFVSFATAGCQCTRQIKCSSINSREACLEVDDCQTLTHPTCSGEKCQTTYCQPSHQKNACAPDDELIRRSCPRDSRTFQNGSVPADIEKQKWAYEKLSPFAKTLAGKKIAKADLAQLTPADSDALCQVYPKESCKLAWNEAKQMVLCETGPINCEACLFSMPKFQCGAKNKCNGVICL